MNLIQQLQATPKWGEFEQWYNQNYNLPFAGFLERDYITGFNDLDFEFQKGVFEKFISETSNDIVVDGYIGQETYGIFYVASMNNKWFATLEELLLWYFNN